MQSHPIAAVLGIPIDILHFEAVGEGTTQAFSARELIEPLLEWIIGVAAVGSRAETSFETKHVMHNATTATLDR